ncbi:hypothetical protein [Streptomyces sp. LaBMicrA B280]|uniref:hypothetical protein n=1 Tax=Streptomyces sp. LaBMicrA B280 TaxID=3391001 RepID=UPI003BA69B88
MSRRVSLPGADELFRTTGGTALQPSTPRRAAGGDARVPAPAQDSDDVAAAEDAPQAVPVRSGDGERRRGPAPDGSAAEPRKRGRAANRRPSGRERHDEKITVYVSAEELMDLEHARLVLRGEHGLAVDRGRIVREAVAVVLADLESRGDASILVRRLRGR